MLIPDVRLIGAAVRAGLHAYSESVSSQRLTTVENAPQIKILVKEINFERSHLDSESRRIRELRRDGERDSSGRIVSRELEIGNRNVGHVGHSGQREILRESYEISI